MNIYEEYQKKLVSAEEAVKLVKDGDWVDYSQTCSFPETLDAALAARKGELKDTKVRNAIAMKPIQVVEQVKKYFGDKVYKTCVPRTVRLSEAPSYGMPINYYEPNGKGSEAYMEMARELLKNNQR